MTLGIFDPFSGASGDMILGALVDGGAPIDRIQQQLDRLGLPIALRAERTSRHGIGGTRVIVDAPDDALSRSWRDIRGLIEASSLPEPAKVRALAIFQRLAAAEAEVHGVPLDDVHFHEVGGLDAIADICGAAIALDLLGVERILCGPLAVGSGFVRTAHGLLPVPAPATAALLAHAGAPIRPPSPAQRVTPVELLTPTGAAILTTIATFTEESFRPARVGYGFGTRDLPWPNALRLWLAEGAGDAVSDTVELQMETNIDDMSPQHVELLTERLFAAGALDVWVAPVQMKKGRPAFTVSALLPTTRRDALAAVFIEQSTTLGVRCWPVERTKAVRRFETIATRWGDVTVKLRGWNGHVIDAAPEYDDCARLARRHDVPLREIWNEAYRLASPFVGRRIAPDGTFQ